MRNLIFMICAGLACAFTSCNRNDGLTVVEGQVVDKFTSAAVPNATLKVYSMKSNSFSGAFTNLEIEKSSDGKGNFSFSFDSENDRDYALLASKSNYYIATSEDAIFLEEDRKNKKLKVKMQPAAWARVKFVNVPPIDIVSMIYLGSFSDVINGQDFISLINYDRDSIIVRRVLGNKEKTFLYNLYDMAGNKVSSNPVVFFPALDTVELLIEY